jgi:hypothetical protein
MSTPTRTSMTSVLWGTAAAGMRANTVLSLAGFVGRVGRGRAQGCDRQHERRVSRARGPVADCRGAVRA